MRFNRIRPTSALIFFSSAVLLSGCAAFRSAGWDSNTSPTEGSAVEAKQAIERGLTHWLKRDQRPDLEMALAEFGKAAEAEPSNFDNLILLTRGYYILADGHLEDLEEKKQTWDRGTAWGERALATNAAFKKKVKEEGRNLEDALDVLTKREVPALYWTAVNLGKWARLSGLGTMLKYKNRIKMMVERVEQLEPLFFHGAVPRYWGTYYAVAPGFAGGSMEKSFAQYERSLKLENNYFGTHVLFAENYATRKNDRELFKKHLNFVLNGKPASMPGLEPEQRLEQNKAKKMLEQIEDLF